MKIDEIKLRSVNVLNNTIDSILPKSNIVNILFNTCFKYYIEQNLSKIDQYLLLLSDSNGEIDIDRFLYILDDQIFNNNALELDLKSLIKLPTELNNILPEKIVIKKEDIYSILQ